MSKSNENGKGIFFFFASVSEECELWKGVKTDNHGW